MNYRGFCLSLAVALLGLGVQLAGPRAVLAQVPAPSASEYVVGPQDVLDVTVFGEAEVSGKFTVEADGTFNFPLIGRVQGGGRTLRRIEQELHDRLADGYFQNPQVSVAVGKTSASESLSSARCATRAHTP